MISPHSPCLPNFLKLRIWTIPIQSLILGMSNDKILMLTHGLPNWDVFVVSKINSNGVTSSVSLNKSKEVKNSFQESLHTWQFTCRLFSSDLSTFFKFDSYLAHELRVTRYKITTFNGKQGYKLMNEETHQLIRHKLDKSWCRKVTRTNILIDFSSMNQILELIKKANVVQVVYWSQRV